MPDLYYAALDARLMLDSLGEDEATGKLYAGLPATNFSREVLAKHPTDLAVLPVSGVGWIDLGNPQRVRLVAQEVSGQLDPLVA